MARCLTGNRGAFLLDRQLGDGPRGFSYCNHLLGEVLLGYRVELGRDLFEG